MLQFQFDNALLTLERRLVRNQPSPRRLTREQWEATTRYQMQYRQMFELNPKQLLSSQAVCGDYVIAAIVKADRDVGSSGVDGVLDSETRQTENPAVVQVITRSPPGATFPSSNIDTYIIEDDSLRDYRGGKQSFVHAKDALSDHPSYVKMEIRLRPEVRLELSFSSFPCVLRQAVQLTRFVRDFFSIRIRSSR